jgi:oligoribonuclease
MRVHADFESGAICRDHRSQAQRSLSITIAVTLFDDGAGRRVRPDGRLADESRGSTDLIKNENNLIWLDLEMTGLDPSKDRILEIATLITDSDLCVLAEGPVAAIHQPEQVLAGMDDWNREHHGQSGLLDRVRASGLSESDAESMTLQFLSEYVPSGASPLCGNSICQDRRFLALWMPTLESYCHYRNLDVSTLKILAQRWAPDVASDVKKASRHLALDDIRESIDELRHYRTHLFR